MKLRHNRRFGFGRICFEDDYRLGIVAGKLNMEWYILEKKKTGIYHLPDLVNDPERLRLFVDGVNDSGSIPWRDIVPELIVLRKAQGKPLFQWRIINWAISKEDGLLLWDRVQKAIEGYTVEDPQIDRIRQEVAETLHIADARWA